VSGTHHFLTDERFGLSFVHLLDPRAKILGFLGFVFLVVSTPAHQVWALALHASVLVFLLGLSRLPVLFVLRKACVVLPFVFLVAIFVPFFSEMGSGGYNLGGIRVSRSGLVVLWNVVIKSTLGVLSIVILGCTTSFPELIAGFEGLKVPRLFTWILAFMYRYSFLLAEEYRRMRRAMEARNHALRWLWDAPMLAHVIGSLFLRSYNRAERVHVAMLSRGYDGAMRVSTPLAFRTIDGVFLLILLLVVLAIRVAAQF
jgi:cobalt/nickel transport system permease protein